MSLGYSLARSPRTWINLWLLLALFLLIAVSLAAWNQFTMLNFAKVNLTALCESVRDEYQQSGAKRSDEAVSTIGLMAPRIHLVNTLGVDLVDGTDRSALLKSGASRFYFRPEGALALPVGAGISCVLEAPPRMPGGGLPAGLWALPLISLLCFTVAVYVSKRSRKLETALVDFGAGRLDARIAWDSSDPLGRLSKRFNEMAERIESLVHAQQRLCVDLSHELRSPLARLALAIRLVREGRLMALDQVERETTRLSELVEELLDVARAEADPNTIEAEPIEILPLVEEIAAQCEIEARAKGCWIEISCFRPGAIQGDRELLRRALENVFRNAIRYGPPDAMIKGTVSGADNGVTIQVRDSGPGVPPESLDLVFDPFYRVSLDRDRKTGGVGLGLAITKRAISLHGGTVRALNQVPGLMVEISLPRSMPGPVPGSQYLASPPVQRA